MYEYVREFDQHEGHKTLFLFHVDLRLLGSTERFVDKWLVRKAAEYGCKPNSTEMDVCGDREERSKVRFHHRMLRKLCGGLNPTITVCGADGPMPLLDLLRIPASDKRTIGVLGCKQRYRISKAIGAQALKQAKNDAMSALSCLDDGAWDYVGQEWEFREHRDREQVRQSRQETLPALAFPGLDIMADTKLRSIPGTDGGCESKNSNFYNGI